jgi:sialidase-1
LGDNTPLDKANETTVAEISKGALMLNSRSSDRKIKYRQVATSTDGGQTWADMHTDSTLIQPICQGSLLNYNLSSKKSILLFSNPASQATRANLTLRVSLNDGKSWSAGQVVFVGPSAYSDIAVNKSKQVVCFYEAGLTKPYEGIAIKLIDLNQLLKP